MTKLKHMPAGQLTQGLHNELGEAYRLQLDTAIALAAELHKNQTRSDPVQGRARTPYIEHPLRCALRLVRLLKSPATKAEIDIITAMLLHDTVEDCAHVFAPHAVSEEDARNQLRAHIQNEYGDDVMTIIDDVTNPLQAHGNITNTEKNLLYCTHVTQAIQQSIGSFLVKFSDYADNAGSLHHSPAHKRPRTIRLAVKYQPLALELQGACFRYMNDNATAFDLEQIGVTLLRIQERLNDIVEHNPR